MLHFEHLVAREKEKNLIAYDSSDCVWNSAAIYSIIVKWREDVNTKLN